MTAPRWTARPWTARRLMLGAALLHLTLAVALFAVGRAQLAPQLLDGDGVARLSDSLLYREEAVQLLDRWRAHGTAAWAAADARPHVRLLSVAFALLGPMVGPSVLAAEPLNLACYLAIVGLVLALGREIGGPRAGLLAATAVAIWPTFLFHTTQLLKDPPFVAGALALVLVVTTWLTRVYRPRDAVAAAAVLAVATCALLLIRDKFFPVVAAIVLLGLTLLVVRQLSARRRLPWNLACALGTAAIGALALVNASRPLHKQKAPAGTLGVAKSAPGLGSPRRALLAWRDVTPGDVPAAPVARVADVAAVALGSVRGRYNRMNGAAGSGIDDAVELRDGRDVMRYLPRALGIGLWAPFPTMWVAPGAQVGRAGRLLAGIETLVIYACQGLAVAAVAFGRRRLAALLLLGLSVVGMTTIALVVSNVGTLYRFRFPFWMLLVVLGASGLEAVAARRRAA